MNEFEESYWRNALCGYPHVKVSIRDLSQISTAAPIFQLYIYFRQNLEENVTFTFYFFSFASNFPCKILWDNKNIDANICIFQIAFSQWRAGLWKNYFEIFFCDWPLLSSWKISALTVQPFTFFYKKNGIFYYICGENIFPAKYLRFYTSQKNLISFGPKMSTN